MIFFRRNCGEEFFQDVDLPLRHPLAERRIAAALGTERVRKAGIVDARE